jgi:hypothetical protein
MHASKTQKLMAIGTLKFRARLRMARTLHGAVGENDRRAAYIRTELGNGHMSVDGLDEEFDNIAQTQHLAGIHLGLRDSKAVEESSVRGLAVADDDASVTEDHFAMAAGYSRVLDLDFTILVSSKAIAAKLKRDDPIAQFGGFQQQGSHRADYRPADAA